MNKSIFSKRPWYRRMPNGFDPRRMMALSTVSVGGQEMMLYSQQRMLDEYYPTSHDIYNRAIYPDIPHEVDELVTTTNADGSQSERLVKKTYVEEKPRTAFSYQQFIETKRTDHLTGNDVVFNRNWSKGTQEMDDNYQLLIDGWEQHDLEDAIYEAVHNANIVGDAALVFYLHKDDFGAQCLGRNVYSFFKGDDIYAHQDARTGNVLLFARRFTDEAGHDMCEVWDSRFYYLFSMTGEEATDEKHFEFPTPNGTYELNGYRLRMAQTHGFPFCPVCYHRNEDGPVWVFSQDSIEAYEEDFNQLRHNNKTFGEPILVTKGDDVEGIPELDGTIKNISMGKDDDASYLQGQSASESYMRALDKLEELIYIQSFCVKTPELKSGDLPAAALKIIYSPAVEKAMHEVKEWQPFINRMFDIFRYGFGIIKGKTIDFSPANLPIKAFLVPYTHQSEGALVADLVSSVNSGILSKQTASERLSGYVAEEDEWKRIVAEQKEQQQADLLYETSVANANSNPTE